MFGSEIERVLGTRRYLIYYFASVVGAAVMHLIVTRMMGGLLLPTVGASGGVFGLLLAFGMFFPQRRILLLIPPIPMKAWVFVTLYGLIELAMGVFGTGQGVAHFAHLGGMLAGFLLLSYWRAAHRVG
jgi:membrane associated rhomboid family serine protease